MILKNPMSSTLISTLSCPLRGEIMQDPVILACSGVSYERSAIENWIECNATDPDSGEPLTDARLIENPCLRALIEAVVVAASR